MFKHHLKAITATVGLSLAMSACGGLDLESAKSLAGSKDSPPFASIALEQGGRQGSLQISNGAGEVLLTSLVRVQKEEGGNVLVSSLDDKGIYFKLSPSQVGYLCHLGCSDGRPFRLPMMWSLQGS